MEEIRVVTVNQPFTVFPGTPFGGFKQSGWGREVSLEALGEFTERLQRESPPGQPGPRR